MTTPPPSRLTALLDALAPSDGVHDTALAGVQAVRASQSAPFAPAQQEPAFYVVLQGRKVSLIGAQRIEYQAGQVLVVSTPLHLHCATEASPDEPLLALSVAVQPALVHELLPVVQRQAHAWPSTPARLSVAVTPLDGQLSDLTLRLLHALHDPADAQVLGPGLLREWHYRLLQSPAGPLFSRIGPLGGTADRISRIIERLHAHPAAPVDVPTLAAEAHLSPTGFHQAFRRVTGQSPMQYLKTMRLHHARHLILNAGLSAAQAAYAVGYSSPTQFSREYRRLFGTTPAQSRQQPRSSTAL